MNRSEVVTELSKYSKEALINAFINNNLYSSETIIREVKHEEFQIVSKKEDEILKKMRGLDPIKNNKEYVKLRDSYLKYSKQSNKLLGL